MKLFLMTEDCIVYNDEITMYEVHFDNNKFNGDILKLDFPNQEWNKINEHSILFKKLKEKAIKDYSNQF